MERGRLLSDHRGQPSPRRAESYISARRPATPAGGRCSKYRPEASPVGFGRPVRPKRCGSPASVPTECAAQSASRDGAAFGRNPLRGGRGWPHPPKAGAAKRAERPPGPAGGRVSGKRPSRSANCILRSEKMRGFRNAPRLRGAKVREHSVRARSDRRAAPPRFATAPRRMP